MTNDETIAELETIEAELSQRLAELKEWEQNPGGEFWQAVQRLDDIYSQEATLIMRRHHVRKRLRMRILSRQLQQGVPPLSGQNASRLRKALEGVSKSIAGHQTLEAALDVASAVATAAGEAARAAA